jgi:aryl-alcohol dehydrogenase-like predicted oxidoreductase
MAAPVRELYDGCVVVNMLHVAPKFAQISRAKIAENRAYPSCQIARARRCYDDECSGSATRRSAFARRRHVEHRELGRTGIQISTVGFGMWTTSTGWWGEHTDEGAVALLHEARDLGFTFFDASDSYGEGRSEEQLGAAFGNDANVVIATKVGYDFYTHGGERRGQREIPQDFSPAYIRRACDQSLRRLKRNRIDFYQLHNPKMDTIARDETFACLDDLVREGKVRSYGVALGPAIGWEEEGVRAARERNIAGMQIIYNMLEQDPGRAQIAACRDANVGVIARVPHSSGMLEGHYSEDTVFAENDHRRHRPRSWLLNGLKKIEQLGFLTDARPGATLGQIALKWILADPSLCTTLPNIYGSEQLREFAAASDVLPLTPDELARIQALYDDNFGLDREPENATARRAAGATR